MGSLIIRLPLEKYGLKIGYRKMEMIDKQKLIEAGGRGVQDARRQLYDNCNGDNRSSNLLAREMRFDIAEYFAKAALTAIVRELPKAYNEMITEERMSASHHFDGDELYQQLKELGE